MLGAGVTTGRALVELGAIEFVDPVVARKTLAGIRTDDVYATGVCVAVMTLRAALLFALVHVWNTQNNSYTCPPRKIRLIIFFCHL